jgi:hypothetical protein
VHVLSDVAALEAGAVRRSGVLRPDNLCFSGLRDGLFVLFCHNPNRPAALERNRLASRI